MFIIKDLTSINLDMLSESLSCMRIEKLNIIVINSKCEVNTVTIVKADKYSFVYYLELSPECLINLILADSKFLENNKDYLYLLKDGNFFDIKALFNQIQGCKVNICKGSSQKSHNISSLDFRLSSYILALFSFNYKQISYLNAFNVIGKDKYLSWSDDFKCRPDKKKPLIRRVYDHKPIIRRVYDDNNTYYRKAIIRRVYDNT
ncbi:MAG TPA: hypothetical protein VIY08_02995 [Candidatus Nitrosocosmicus sp.]